MKLVGLISPHSVMFSEPPCDPETFFSSKTCITYVEPPRHRKETLDR